MVSFNALALSFRSVSRDWRSLWILDSLSYSGPKGRGKADPGLIRICLVLELE
jgi:hypothetical protein